MPVSGLDWKFQVKDMSRLFRRWGSHASNVRGVFNGILPVQIIDRWRDDGEGSLYSLFAGVTAAAFYNGQHPSIAFGTFDERVEIEILGWQAYFRFITNRPVSTWNTVAHIFSPQTPYNPVAFLSPAGQFVPGLITNYSFHLSTAFALAGYNAAMPAYAGWTGWPLSWLGRAAPTNNVWYALADQAGSYNLRTPIRLPPGDSIAWQMECPTVNGQLELAVGILYRERTYRA